MCVSLGSRPRMGEIQSTLFDAGAAAASVRLSCSHCSKSVIAPRKLRCCGIPMILGKLNTYHAFYLIKITSLQFYIFQQISGFLKARAYIRNLKLRRPLVTQNELQESEDQTKQKLFFQANDFSKKPMNEFLFLPNRTMNEFVCLFFRRI